MGVATKFSPKLPQASRANGRKMGENLQILEILAGFLLNKRRCVWVHVRQDRLAPFKVTAVLKAFICAQLIILMGSLGEISTLALAIKNTLALNSVFTYLGIFNQSVKPAT